MWPNTKHLWQIFVLWVFWVLFLWLMAPCLDPRPESAPQEKLMVLGMNSASGLGQMWEKLFKVIPRPSVSHFHLYCGTCALVGDPTTLRASGLSHNVNQCTAAFRMNHDHAQSFETAGNQTTGCFVYPWNASIRGSWRQLVLLLLQLSGLAWTSDAPSEEVSLFGWGQTSS
uniref:beta-D-galactosyl-(1->3)-N-acetyl-beta-D-galactosaminide alpha-2,3-sialyltransferase n=1 Tax=Callorhinus ursinus TaxID=34884 RepID=A0A3Q7QUR0_CALUR|nr:uncharacterized protein C20orf173-like [Callorhinus ursinus]